MEIDVVFDTVCPWCFIGKRRLEQAIRMRPDLEVKPRWRPFLLNPEMPAEGLDRTVYLVKKFGSEARVRRIQGAINEAGLSVEIPFAFDRIQKTPNSVNSHRLVRFADRAGRAAETVEALFHAFFLDGTDVGDVESLAEIGARVGLDPEAVTDFLESTQEIDEVMHENARAHRLGINGVPCYVFNGRVLISGAQEPQVLARMLDAACEAERVA